MFWDAAEMPQGNSLQGLNFMAFVEAERCQKAHQGRLGPGKIYRGKLAAGMGECWRVRHNVVPPLSSNSAICGILFRFLCVYVVLLSECFRISIEVSFKFWRDIINQ